MKRRVLTSPADAVIFDCDGTLSTVEGVVELAKQGDVFQQVSDLTEAAMQTSGVNHVLYRQRLELLQPSLDQVTALADLYWQHLTPGVDQLVKILQKLGKSVFVASAGIAQAVVPFAARLNIAPEKVYSVALDFHEDGSYQDFDASSPLVRQYGKAEIVESLRQDYRCIVHIGDGMNDAEAAKAVDLFIGYGGTYYRQSIADLSDVYLSEASMMAALPFILTDKEKAEFEQEIN